MIDGKAILQEVRENHARLQACPLHNFQPVGDPRRPLGMKYECIACRGWVDASAKLWYERGLAHADAGHGHGTAVRQGSRL